MSKFITVILILLVVVIGTHFIAEARFKKYAAGLIQQVAAAKPPILVSEDIPQLILDFVKNSGVEPDNLASVIEFRQVAEMRLEKGGDWQGLTAEQIISVGEIGFVWYAEQPMMGFLKKFRVIDAYVAKKGMLNVRVLGSIPMGDVEGEDADFAEAMRYISEMVWAPDAMIGNPALNWQQLTDRSVYVSVDLPSGVAGATFIFDDAGDIIEVQAKNRPAEMVDGKAVLRDWLIEIGDYKQFGTRRVARHAVVSYLYEDGYEAYWRGDIISYAASRG